MTALRFLIPAILLLSSCMKLGEAPIPADYDTQLEAWKQARIASLTAPTGWMRLSDMLWLDEGSTPFLSDSLTRTEFRVFYADSLVYDTDHAPMMADGDIRWTIIRRGNLLGARVWNTVNAEVEEDGSLTLQLALYQE
jgi:uncharacterized protein (DUF1684 family)